MQRPGQTASQKFAQLDEQYADRLASMSMSERALLGLPYIATDRKLMLQRLRARKLEHEYNQSPPGPAPDYIDKEGNVVKGEAEGEWDDVTNANRRRILAELFHVTPERARTIAIEPPFHVDFGRLIDFKGNFYANAGLCILDVAQVTIGRNVLCGPGVAIYTATHSVSLSERGEGYERALPVVIGDDVWLGGNCSIQAGVTIGKGCTIGAGSVVTRDVPDWSVAVGNPARVVKTLSQEERELKKGGEGK